jgi:hypothetical protein
MKTLRVNQVADRVGKHPATVWRWIARGCDIDSEDSIQQFLSGKKRRQHPKAAQEFYLRASETLRRLDLAVVKPHERRNVEEQVPKKQAEAISLCRRMTENSIRPVFIL